MYLWEISTPLFKSYWMLPGNYLLNKQNKNNNKKVDIFFIKNIYKSKDTAE